MIMKKWINLFLLFSLILVATSCQKKMDKRWYYDETTHWHLTKKGEKMDEEEHHFISSDKFKQCSICSYQTPYSDEENYMLFFKSKQSTLLYEDNYTYQHTYESEEYQESVLEMFHHDGLFLRKESLKENLNNTLIEVSQNIDIVIIKNEQFYYSKITFYKNEKNQWDKKHSQTEVDAFYNQTLKEYDPSSTLKSDEAQYIEGNTYQDYLDHLFDLSQNSDITSLTPFLQREDEDCVKIGYQQILKAYPNIKEAFILTSYQNKITHMSFYSFDIENSSRILGPLFNMDISLEYTFSNEQFANEIAAYSSFFL